MPSLEILQNQMRAALICSDQRFEDCMAPLLGQLAERRLPPRAGLAVHRNNLRISLTAALEATYPVVRRLVGEKFFAFAAASYILRARPEQPCLEDYGGGFAGFLATFQPCSELAYLPDVARLEWARNEVVTAPDSCPVDTTLLASALPVPEALRLHLAPSARWLALSWPADEIWEAHRQAEVPPLSLSPGRTFLELWREDGQVLCRRIDEAGHALRMSLLLGESFAEAAQQALDRDPVFDLALDLSRLFRARLVTGFTLLSSAA